MLTFSIPLRIIFLVLFLLLTGKGEEPFLDMVETAGRILARLDWCSTTPMSGWCCPRARRCFALVFLRRMPQARISTNEPTIYTAWLPHSCPHFSHQDHNYGRRRRQGRARKPCAFFFCFSTCRQPPANPCLQVTMTKIIRFPRRKSAALGRRSINYSFGAI